MKIATKKNTDEIHTFLCALNNHSAASRWLKQISPVDMVIALI